MTVAVPLPVEGTTVTGVGVTATGKVVPRATAVRSRSEPPGVTVSVGSPREAA